MSLEHKAFVLDYEGFKRELKSILERALSTGDTDELVEFIESNLASLKDPYEGEPLDDSWQDWVETKDAHQYGDFALTKFYDPVDDLGLGYTIQEVQTILQRELGTDKAVLGDPIGEPNAYFDPGKMGSYFQSSDQVKQNLEKIEALLDKKPALDSSLGEWKETLATAANDGLYITF